MLFPSPFFSSADASLFLASAAAAFLAAAVKTKRKEIILN